MTTQVPPYFAVTRTIFDHPLFVKHPEWMRPFLWLISDAAWKPRGKRLSHGIVHIERGQLACTIRGLANQWRWKRGNVEYFLRRLREEEMIETTSLPTKIQTKVTTRNSYAATVITICNYDKFQVGGQSRLRNSQVLSPNIRRNFRQDLPQLPGLTEEMPTEAEQSIKTIEKEAASTIRSRQKPRHGKRAQTRDGLMVWVDHGTQEWEIHARDYQSVRNLAILPKVYQGGRGNWFMVHGEAARNRTSLRRTASGR